LEKGLLAFKCHYEESAIPVERKFTGGDLAKFVGRHAERSFHLVRLAG
jgi:hypothetical protein